MKNLQWITCCKEWQSPVFRKSFILGEIPEAAKIKICGLGFFELYINGQRVTNHYFQPVWSDYEKRDLSTLIYPIGGYDFTHRVYYLVYDVGRFLKPGKNVIAVMLGNGWYRQTMRKAEGCLSYSEELKLAFQLTLKNETGVKRTVFSDKGTKCRQGHIIANNIYYGETHDYSLYDRYFETDYDDSEWVAAQETDAPRAVFTKQDCPPDRIIRSVKPAIICDYGRRKIYDAGENITGWAAVTGKGNVTIRYAENIKDGELDFASAGFPFLGVERQMPKDAFWGLNQNGFVHPVFCWHGFRYFEVEGETDEIRVDIVHADVKVKKKLESNNDNLNWLYNAFVRTQLSNMHCGVPSDCPHRERLGYTGDGQLVCDAAMLIFDCKKFYRKWIRDILDCQDIKTGHVRHTAPFYGGGGGPGGWGGAIVIVPYTYYKHYGDKKLLAKCLPYILHWLECMRGFSDGGLIVREIEGGWCLGDWCTPGKVLLPEPFINTYYYVKCMRYVEEIAAALGETVNLANDIKGSLKAIKKNYFDERTQSFCGGVQGADAFGLDLGLGGEKTLQNLTDKYSHIKGFDTGIFGTDILCKVLCENGRKDVVLRLLSLTEYPSFGYMKAQGATTLWETWNGDASHNHPMFGACVKHLAEGL